MKVVTSATLAVSLVVFALLAACSDKKSFAGGTPAGAVAKTDDAEPIVEEEKTSTVKKDPPQVDFQDCDTSDNNVFVADLYELPENTQILPDFKSMTSIKQICLKQIDITNRIFTEGFPGVTDLNKWFGLNFHFKLKITKAGNYKFKTKSDDGSILSIDGEVVVNSDGQHSAKDATGERELTAGTHDVNLKYFQGPPNEIALELYWTPPGESESYIPTKYISRATK